MRYTDIEFSVVNGSSEEMLFACLESLHAAMRSGSSYSWSVTVTCSAEADRLLGTRVHERYPHARIIENLSGRDVSSSHGAVVRSSQARYVWLLNDDVIFLAGAVEKLAGFMDRPENSRVAVAGPQLLNPDGLLTRSGYGFPSMRRILLEQAGLDTLSESDVLRRWMPSLASTEARSTRLRSTDRAVEVDTLPGACVALRLKAVRQTGLMLDPAPVRGAETEWHRRFRENGWKVMLLGDVSVIHYGNQIMSTGFRHFRPEHLKGALYFFRTGRSPAVFSLFCASLLALFGVRAAVGWVKRDRVVVGLARRHAHVAWEGLVQG